MLTVSRSISALGIAWHERGTVFICGNAQMSFVDWRNEPEAL